MKRFYRHALFCMVTALAALSVGAAFGAQEKTSPMTAPEIKAKKTNETSSLSGTVVETMNSGGYSYVCLEKKGKKTWVAVPEMKISVGQQLSLQPGMEMPNFTSKSLGRTFDSIIFSNGPAALPQDAGGLPPGHGDVGKKAASGKSPATKVGINVIVEKASGANAYTVGEIFEKRSALNKKTVVVRAKVVKVSAGIMNTNFIHLQDGTGDSKKSTNNLVATSDDLPSVGDVVTMKGTIVKDKDFGSGYSYTVIMEKARIQH
jgi:hypothetical protein